MNMLAHLYTLVFFMAFTLTIAFFHFAPAAVITSVVAGLGVLLAYGLVYTTINVLLFDLLNG
jgi:hypothetical protein